MAIFISLRAALINSPIHLLLKVLITGASIGSLGFEAIHGIAKYAKLVILVGRNQQKWVFSTSQLGSFVISHPTHIRLASLRLQKAEDKITADYPEAKVQNIVADLTSFKSVRNAAAEINALGEPIHVCLLSITIPINDVINHNHTRS